MWGWSHWRQGDLKATRRSGKAAAREGSSGEGENGMTDGARKGEGHLRRVQEKRDNA